MNTNLTITFTVDETPEEAFRAINNVRAWWSGEIEGATDEPGAEWTYTVPDIHFSKFQITDWAPGHRVAWKVLDSYLSFTADQQEWTGTTVAFDIAERDGHTQVTFTHEGLTPSDECYNVCSNAWGMYINGSLRDLITTGTGAPSSFEGQKALAAGNSN
jgi:hypothetical protein